MDQAAIETDNQEQQKSKLGNRFQNTNNNKKISNKNTNNSTGGTNNMSNSDKKLLIQPPQPPKLQISLDVKPAETNPGRNKVALAKGFSLMDWIRFTKNAHDLGCNGGTPRKVSLEELAKHSKEDDCWMAIQNKVYNVTQYMKYHPGGVDELMKGAGVNATKMFNDVHPWVNYQSMLEKCFVGPLVGPSLSSISTASSSSSLASQPSNLLKPPVVISTTQQQQQIHDINTKKSDIQSAIEIPVLDSYQSIETVTIVLYAKCKTLNNDCLTVDKLSESITNQLKLIVYLYVLNNIYKYLIDIPAPIRDDYQST